MPDALLPIALPILGSIVVALLGFFTSKRANRTAARKATQEMFSALCEAQQFEIKEQRAWILDLREQIAANEAEIVRLRQEARDREEKNEAEITRLLGRIHDLETENEALHAEIAALKAHKPARQRERVMG